MEVNYIYNPKLKDIVITPLMGFDTEFNSLDTLHARLICFSLKNEKGNVYVCEYRNYSKDELVEFFNKLGQIEKLICHNSKVEIGIIKSNVGVLLRNCWCTMMASQIIDNGYGYKVKKETLIAENYTMPGGHDNTIWYYTANMVGNIKYMQHPHGLISTLKRYIGVELIEHQKKKLLQRSFITYDFAFNPPLNNDQLEYAAEDAVYMLDLYKEQCKYIKQRQLEHIVSMENKLTPVLVKIEFKGCKVDIEQHKQNIIKWSQKLADLCKQLDNILLKLTPKYPALKQYDFDKEQTVVNQMDMFGGLPKEFLVGAKPFNYASPKQLQELFVACGQECPMEEDKITFGEEALIFYITNNPDSNFIEFLNTLLEHREYEKLVGTYAEKILHNLDGNRVRTSYGQTFTETGRLNSAEVISKEMGLNLANIPKNPDIRKIFIPDNGFVFIDSDMTGQELVIAGDFSKEPVLLKAFQEGFDHHSFLASISYSLIFGQQIEIKNKKEYINIDGKEYDIKKLRDVHKNCLFSKIYLGGPKRIQAYLNEYLVAHVPANERFNRCKQISDALDETIKTLITYLKGEVTKTKKQGYIVANKLGRRRYFDQPKRVYGDAANMPIQGTGADAMKIALINLDKFFETKSKELGITEDEFGWISMTVYDQVLCCLNKKYLDYKNEIPKIMGNAITYFLTTLTGSSDLNIREFWGK